MRIMGRRAAVLLALCLMFGLATLIFLGGYAKNAGSWAVYPYNRHLFQNGRLKNTGRILDRDGIVFYQAVDGTITYNPDAGVRKAALHLTGDGQGNIATCLPQTQRRALTGWNALTGTYALNPTGRDLATTLDAGLMRTASKALGNYKGAVGVVNYKTGDVLCMVSSPGFDPQKPPDIAANPDKYQGVYLNRLLSSTYTPGSIFKLLTLSAALETLPDVQSRTFTCTGTLALEGGDITCPQAHGDQTLGEALTRSCNCTFAALALEVGGDTMARYADKAGFGSRLALDGALCAQGSFSMADQSEALMGWTGVGQGKTLLNPMTYLMYVASIANGGQAVTPHLLEGTHLINGAGRTLQSATAQTLKALMRGCVTDNYGEHGLKGYNLCAKSGTAQVGGNAPANAWFTGFLDSAEAPYAFIVIAEGGGAGSQTAATIAEAVLKHAVELVP